MADEDTGLDKGEDGGKGSNSGRPSGEVTRLEVWRSIGEVSADTGLKVPTIRYYEEIGMIAKPVRTGGNQRAYGRPAADRLRFIAHARELGFGLGKIRELLDLSDHPDQSCEKANAITRAHLKDVKNRIARLLSLQKELENMVHVCATGGTVAQCRVIETLADHGKCLEERH